MARKVWHPTAVKQSVNSYPLVTFWAGWGRRVVVVVAALDVTDDQAIQMATDALRQLVPDQEVDP